MQQYLDYLGKCLDFRYQILFWPWHAGRSPVTISQGGAGLWLKAESGLKKPRAAKKELLVAQTERFQAQGTPVPYP